MGQFHAQFWDADHLLFKEVTGVLDRPDEQPTSGSTGNFEVHEGGILGGDVDPLHDRVYRLVFDDGQAWQVRLNKVHASNSAGIARVDFRIDVSTDPAPPRP
jgi:hypothetical protein